MGYREVVDNGLSEKERVPAVLALADVCADSVCIPTGFIPAAAMWPEQGPGRPLLGPASPRDGQ